MRSLWMLIGVIVLSAAAVSRGDDAPLTLAEMPVDNESVYAPTPTPPESEWGNNGGVNFDLRVSYVTDYIYRGIDFSEESGSEDSPNLQMDERLTFNLGRAPHPFAGLFVNVNDSDPVSRFQEIRPYIGLEWTFRQLTVAAGQTTYIYPEREDVNTAEVWGLVSLDDSFLWGTDRAILTPYIYGAYDYDLYKGWYLEAGVKHTFVIPDTGVTVILFADIAYVMSFPQFALTPDGQDSGWQHYDIGMTASYSLNSLFNFPKRYGEWRIEGYLNYIGGLNEDLLANNQVWGGGGISFHY